MNSLAWFLPCFLPCNRYIYSLVLVALKEGEPGTKFATVMRIVGIGLVFTSTVYVHVAVSIQPLQSSYYSSHNHNNFYVADLTGGRREDWPSFQTNTL